MFTACSATRVALCLVLLGLPVLAPAAARTGDVTAERAQALIQARGGTAGFAVLDVRTPVEFAQGHLPGALNLDIASPDFPDRVAKLDRGKTYLVYCRTGNRSAHAVRIMRQLGFKSILHMSEGIVGWQRKQFALTRP